MPFTKQIDTMKLDNPDQDLEFVMFFYIDSEKFIVKTVVGIAGISSLVENSEFVGFFNDTAFPLFKLKA